MTDPETNIHVLDAAYRPFPTFADWSSNTTVDTVRWDRYTAELKKGQPSSPSALNRAYEIVKRAAALDTGAIEGLYEVDRGFTYSVAFETAAWELELAKRGENVRPLFEAQLRAYEYVLSLATRSEPISEASIRELHKVVCGAQSTYRVMTAVGPQEQTLVIGKYKVLPNHVRTREGSNHSYAPVDVTPMEMARLIEEMRTQPFLAAHPVLQAAYAHYSLVVIHPFADGNGRVARALASAFTYRAISMPIVILSEHKVSYLDSLEAADAGQYQSFVGFMLARSLDTIKLVEDSIIGAQAPSSDQAAASLDSLFITKGGYTQEQVDQAGGQLLQAVEAELSKTIHTITSRNLSGNTGIVKIRDRRSEPDATYRLPVNSNGDLELLHIEFSSSPPAQARVFRNHVLWLPRDAASDDDIHVVLVQVGVNSLSVNTEQKYFSARMEDLIPAPSGVLQIRIGLLAERIIGEMLTELRSEAEKELRGQTGRPPRR